MAALCSSLHVCEVGRLGQNATRRSSKGNVRSVLALGQAEVQKEVQKSPVVEAFCGESEIRTSSFLHAFSMFFLLFFHSFALQISSKFHDLCSFCCP